MGGGSPKPVKTPFEQRQTNTFAPVSVAGTPEAKALLDVPLDFAEDPSAGSRTNIAEQEAQHRWDSAFMSGVPSFIREQAKERELRDIRSRGSAEQAAAEADAKNRRIMTELERRRQLLPQIAQTSGLSSGFNTQLTQPQPGFLSSFGQGFGAGLGGALPFI